MSKISDTFKNIMEQVKYITELNRQLASGYHYMGLEVYQNIHESFYMQGIMANLWLTNYYIDKYKEMPSEVSVDIESIIPPCWYDHKVSDVPCGIRKKSVSNFMSLYIEKLKEAHKLYKEEYDNLLSLGEINTACKIYELVSDAEENIHNYELHFAKCKALDFDPMWVS